MNRVSGRRACAKRFHWFVSSNLRSSLTATREPSSANRQKLGTVRAKGNPPDTALVGKRSDQFAEVRFPQFRGFVPAGRQDTGAVRTKRHVGDHVQVCERGAQRRLTLFRMSNQFMKESLRSNLILGVELDRTCQKSNSLRPFSQLELALVRASSA
jgi:hypothetical protein